MKLTYEKPEIELNEYRFADVMAADDDSSSGLVEVDSYGEGHIANDVNTDDPFA